MFSIAIILSYKQLIILFVLILSVKGFLVVLD